MLTRLVLLISSLLLTLNVFALEYPIGQARQRFGMDVAAVYLQPIVMEPTGMMRPAAESDIHIEMDIAAAGSNGNGFEAGSWIPYLVARFKLLKLDSGKVIEGDLMPMVASDGPHYGDNVKLAGPGRYSVTFFVEPPSANKHTHFGRHTDRLTGVKPWFKPFEVEWTFVYAGVGKKGGY